MRSTYHTGSGVNDFHLLEDGGSIVGDEDLSLGVLDLVRNQHLD